MVYRGGICFSFHRNEYDLTCSYHGPYHSLYHMHHLGTLPGAREPIATDIMISRHGPWHYSTCTLHASEKHWISKIFYYRSKEKKFLRPVLTGAPLVRCVPHVYKLTSPCGTASRGLVDRVPASVHSHRVYSQVPLQRNEYGPVLCMYPMHWYYR